MKRIRRFIGKRRRLRLFAKFIRNTYRLGRVLIGRGKHLTQINFEFCTKCNARCRFCVLDSTRSVLYMTTDILKKCFDEMIEYGHSVERLHITGGEALQHPNFKEMLEVIRLYKENTSVHVFLFTNVLLLDEKMAQLIVDSKAIDTIICSIDGYDKESYEWLRPPGKFDNIVNNVEYLLGLKGRPRVRIANTNAYDNIEPYADYFQDLLNKVDEVTIDIFHDWGGQLKGSKQIEKSPKGFCYWAFTQTYIMANGDIAKCCFDLDGKTACGNLTKNTFGEILTSRRRKKDLLKMFFQQRDKIKGCAGCTLGVD